MTKPLNLFQWLVSRGLTPQQADLWADFICDSLELLREGHLLLRAPSEWSSFLSGCSTTRPTEPEITSGLGDRMKKLRNDAPLDSRRDRLQVGYEVPTPGDERHGIRKSKADFRFERKFEAGYTASFVLEAKSLRAAADVLSAYMGEHGLYCFISRDPPYSRELAVGMVGYARTNSHNWIDELAKALLSDSTATRSANITLPTGQKSLASDHVRSGLGLGDVTVFHAVLDFVGL